MYEFVRAFGHANVRATHLTTLEVTKDDYLTARGDCIIAVRADKAAKDLSEDFKAAAKNSKAIIRITLEAGGLKETIGGFGSERLLFTDDRSFVVRRSDYVCGRTVAIRADKAAGDLSRDLLGLLKNPKQAVKITLMVEA